MRTGPSGSAHGRCACHVPAGSGSSRARWRNNCSWLPWWLWALDERWEAWGDHELFQQDLKPSELFLRQCFVSVEPEEHLAKHVVAEVGDDNLVVSTDWPHDDSRFPHAIDEFLKLPEISEDSKKKILWDNCARLYRL